MNTKVLVGLLAVIIIAGGGYYLYTKSSSGAPTPAQVGSTETSSGGTMSLSALVQSGAAVTCNFSTTTPQGEQTSGTIYVADGMVRGDFTSTGTSAGTIQSHMVVENGTSYMWMDNGQGFKNTVSENSSSAPNQGGVDYNAPGDYNCSAWTPDNSKFTLPTNINFVDYSAMQGSASGGSYSAGAGASGSAAAGGNAEQCAACNQLSGSQKTQCLAALHC